MRIGIFGMGYVGVVSAACLVRDGHHVVGVDAVASKVADLAKGHTPVQEPKVAELLAEGHRSSRLVASTQPADGVAQADMVWICVGTPSTYEAGVDLANVTTVATQIGRSMVETNSRPLVVLRSTVLPGTMQTVVTPALEEASGLRAGKDFHAVFHPEFLREATAVEDFDNPPKIVVGERDRGAGDVLLRLYEGCEAPQFRLTLGEAEMVKYCDNLFHALKITFANEAGLIARSAGIDARRVAEVFCADRKLNISPRYLRPGFAYGGSCLPKDLRAILRHATIQAVPVPMLHGILESNKAQIESLVNRVCAYEPKTVGMVGLAFKANTDDMRESPYVEVAKRLIGEGVRLLIYDPAVQVDNLIGANKAMVEKALKHLRKLLVKSLSALDKSDLILINHASVDADQVSRWTGMGIHVVDLADIPGVAADLTEYEGIAW
ncbi:MAG: nucleotide sugar dehydrogenase [Candidatus Hydrogenedentes bacterium]|nr:nucleotide sugar dehydrogenase [Candidatus Hydrogenedentota bacterium]